MSEKRTPRAPETWAGICPHCDLPLKIHEVAGLVLHQGVPRPVCFACRPPPRGHRT
jgi:hypothetical protein